STGTPTSSWTARATGPSCARTILSTAACACRSGSCWNSSERPAREMSVFTPVSEDEARALLEHYALGELERLEGIAQGVENTNYFLTTTTGEYVLTLFEHIPRADLPFHVGLMDHLAHHHVTCPQPMRRENGEMLSEVNGKPACIVTRLPGAPRVNPDAHACREGGAILGRLHVAALEYDAGLANWRGREWRERFAAEVAPRISREENEL